MNYPCLKPAEDKDNSFDLFEFDLPRFKDQEEDSKTHASNKLNLFITKSKSEKK